MGSRTSARATSTARNDPALMPNTTPAPADTMSAPPRAGPITLARLNWAELRAMAFTMASGGTSDGMNACQVGPFRAKARPCPNVSASTAKSEALPTAASTASTAASSIMRVWVTSRFG